MPLTVEKLMLRHDRALILGLAIGTAVLLICGFIYKNEALSAINGPYLVTPADFANVYHRSDMDKLYIRMENVQVFPASYNRGSHYGAIYVGNHWILVRGREPFVENQYISFTAVVNSLRNGDEEAIYRQVLPRFSNQLAHMKIDTSSSEYVFWYIELGLAALGAGFLIWRIIDQIIIALDPKRHSIMKHLAHYGDVEVVSKKINIELMRGTGKIKNMILAKNWMVYSGWFRTAIFNRGDLLWVYVKAERYAVRVKHIRVYHYYMYRTCIHEKYGQVININCGRNREKATQLATQIARYAPWALQGHDSQLEAAWKTRRNKFITAVEERRTRIIQNAGL